MKKNFLLVLILILSLSLTFVACEQLSHEHTFSTEWTKDATYHYHAATCEHTDETDGKAEHAFEPVPGDNTEQCTVCGYIKGTPCPHPLAEEYSADEHAHWREATCGHDVENAAPHNFVGGICNVCGWWSSATDVIFANLSKADVWDYTLLLDDVSLTLSSQTTEDEAQPKVVTVSGELKLNLTVDGQLEGRGYLMTGGSAYKAVLTDGKAYVCGGGLYARYETEDLLGQMGVNVEQLQAAIDELNARTQEIRLYYEQIRQYLEMLPENDETLKQLFGLFFELDNANSTDQISAYVANSNVLRRLNDMLATTTLQQYVDGMFGDGFFAGIPDLVKELFNLRVSDVVMLVETTTGRTLEELLEIANAVIAQNYPDEDVNTVEQLLAEMGVDLKGETVKELIDKSGIIKLEALLLLAQAGNDRIVTAKDIVNMTDGFCKAYGDKTIYEIIAMSAGDNSQITAQGIASSVEDALDLLDECVKVSFLVDVDGVLQQINVTVYESASEYGQSADGLKKLFASVNGSLVLRRNFTMGQDYSDVVKDVEEYYKSLASAAN